MAEEATAISAAIPDNSSWWHLTSAATTSAAPLLPGSLAAGGRTGRQHYFRDWRRGRTFADLRRKAKLSIAFGSATCRIKWFASCFWNSFIGRHHLGGSPLHRA